MLYCPDCGSANDDTALFCDHCGRKLDDARSARQIGDQPQRGDQKDQAGRLLADDGLPIGEDVDGIPGGERIIWAGRPSKLWSPRLALTNRYRLTTQRLIFERGFIGRQTEEIDLYRVTDVGVKQNALERIVGIGEIYVASGDASSPVKYLNNVKNTIRVKDILREAARQERDRRRVHIHEDM